MFNTDDALGRMEEKPLQVLWKNEEDDDGEEKRIILSMTASVTTELSVMLPACLVSSYLGVCLS